MKQLEEPELTRVRIFFMFSDCRSRYKAEGEWRLAALRCTCSSMADVLNEDALVISSTSVDVVLSLGILKTQLRKQSLHSAHQCLQSARVQLHEP